MNKLRTLLFATIVITFYSCEKEYSLEGGDLNDPLIIGADCRISKIVFTDTSGTAAGGTGLNLGSVAAEINSQDVVTRVTNFDSVFFVINNRFTPVYTNDSIYIDADQYFIVDANKRINKFHGVFDPTNPATLQYDVFYTYNTAGYLVTKDYFETTNPTLPYYKVNYAYASGNLSHMEGIDKVTDEFVVDADLDYYTTISPRRFLYLFPDVTDDYTDFRQFFNFGLKNQNAPKKMKVRYYDPGNVVRDSAVSTFTNYFISKDNYVLSVQMGGDDQYGIPALGGKLSFSYHCK